MPVTVGARMLPGGYPDPAEFSRSHRRGRRTDA